MKTSAEQAAREYWRQHRNQPGMSCGSPHWAVKYIGLPYLSGGRDAHGLDCWGLLRLVYQEKKGILLPDLPGIGSRDALAISREILAQRHENWFEVTEPQDADAVAMSTREVLHHVGVWIDADGGKVLHSWMGCSVVADTIRNLKLRGMRTVRFFRYGSHH